MSLHPEGKISRACAAPLTAGDHIAIHQPICGFPRAISMKITIPEMEIMLKTMLAAGLHRRNGQAGAGFGGCMAAFIGEIEPFCRLPLSPTPPQTAPESSRIYPVQPSPAQAVSRRLLHDAARHIHVRL